MTPAQQPDFTIITSFNLTLIVKQTASAESQKLKRQEFSIQALPGWPWRCPPLFVKKFLSVGLFLFVWGSSLRNIFSN